MGNTQESINENLSKFNMQISLNRFNFFPGETIKGEIELSPKDENSIDFKLINNIKFYFALLHKECWKNNIEVTNIYSHPKENYQPRLMVANTGFLGRTEKTTYRDKGTTIISDGYQNEDVLSRKATLFNE